MSRQDYAIEIKRSGQHPFMAGAVRLSFVLLMVAWVFLVMTYTYLLIPPAPRNLLSALVIGALGVGALWYAGHELGKRNPFFQEVLFRYLSRLIRNRTNLET